MRVHVLVRLGDCFSGSAPVSRRSLHGRHRWLRIRVRSSQVD